MTFLWGVGLRKSLQRMNEVKVSDGIPGGRTFQVGDTASVKALRHVWTVQGTQRGG